MKFRNIVEDLLTEASKKDVLINKLGVNEYNANALAEVAGPLAIFFAYKILEKYEAEYYDTADRAKEIIKRNQISIQNRMALVNGSNSFVRERDKLRSIMDWVRVALGGNIKAYENLSFMEMFDESERWHESLGVGDSKIDYKEENEVIIDFRKDGEGYYWVDLGTSNCPEEAERMGHCGRTRGNIYSLRSFKKIENNHTLNRSHLTASIDSDGDLLQLKGQKNSKPTNEYHKLILPLFYFKDDGEFLITGIGYEYNSEHDFKFSDLTEDEIKKLYSDRPELFSGRQEIRLLKKMGLITTQNIDYHFQLNIHPKYVENFLRGDHAGSAEDILLGNTWEYWDNFEYADWKYALNNEINEENKEKILSILQRMNSNFNIDGLSLEEIISDFYGGNEIERAIRISVSDAESNDYENYLYKELKNALSEYGTVVSMNDEGVTIDVDLEQLIQGINDEEMDEIIERCDNTDSNFDAECVFTELMGDGYIEKPKFNIDDRWYPSVDRDNFNEILNDRLNEI